jgi:Conserved in the green lineage and diatoms 27
MYYKLSCPVPQKQRPINEYMELVQSNFFNWPIQKEDILIQKILKSFSFFFIFCFPFSNLFYSLNQSWIFLFLLNTSCTIFIILLILLRLLLAWTYIKKRLYSPSVFYEESGWYDGRVWVKSKNILVQDRFIYTYQVLPAIRKLKKALIFILCLFVSLLLLFFFN